MSRTLNPTAGGTPPCPASRLAPEVTLGNSADISPTSCGSVSHDCRVQRIIHKYIRELNDSLYPAGNTSGLNLAAVLIHLADTVFPVFFLWLPEGV